MTNPHDPFIQVYNCKFIQHHFQSKYKCRIQEAFILTKHFDKTNEDNH